MSKRARGGLGACAESSKHLSGSEEAEMIAQVADAVAAEAVADASDAASAAQRSEPLHQQQPCSIRSALPDATTLPVPAAEVDALVVPPPSPGRNRQLFMTTVTAQKMTCDLSNAVVGQGVKHNIVAVVIACFPIQNGPPARRHITVCDAFGSTGLTVWNTDVHKFPKDVLGGVVTICRASVSLYQGRKNLVLSKDSTVIVSTTTPSPTAEWWDQLARQPPLPLPAAQVAVENSIINVFGVLAFISHETKEVNGQVRVVTSVHLACQTGRLQLRGWDLEQSTKDLMASLQDLVVQVRRVRMTCFAELKIGEILESPLGSSFSKYIDADLTRHWAE